MARKTTTTNSTTANKAEKEQQQQIQNLRMRLAERLEDYVVNLTSQRAELFRSHGDPRRDIDDEVGLPPARQEISSYLYNEYYNREAVAARVVEMMPLESWKASPELVEDVDPEVSTPFEEAWQALSTSLDEFPDYQEQQDSNPFWDYLLRADIVSGIGRYGVVLLGFNDGKDLSEPVEPRRGMELLYIRPIPEHLAKIGTINEDVTSRRYGKPEYYSIDVETAEKYNEGFRTTSATSIAAGTETTEVHYTRVVHIAETRTSSDIIGIPRMQQVFNNLHGLKKLYAGSPEMFWRGAFPGFSFETDPQSGADVDVDESAMKDSLEQYMNGLQRYILLIGLHAKSHAPQVVDPTPQINVQIDAICICKEWPKRIFLGSERGELSSGQDDRAWNRRVDARRNNYVTPCIIRPFINRLIWAGVLPVPKSYQIIWPDVEAMSDADKAEVSSKVTDSLSKYVSADVQRLITPMDFFVHVLGFDDKTAEAIIDNAEELLRELESEAEALLEESTEEGLNALESEAETSEEGSTSSQDLATLDATQETEGEGVEETE